MTPVTPGARPADLVPGDPDQLDRLAARLVRVAASASDAAGRLEVLDTEVWTGESAQVYRAAIGDVPVRLARAAGAFGAAAQALSAYARAVRDARASAAGAVRMVEQATPQELAAVQQSAAATVARATAEVQTAAQLAVQRLALAEADAPLGAPAGVGCDVALQLDAEHELTDPDGFVSLPADWADTVAEMRYTAPHDVPFAAALGGEAPPVGTGDAGWHSWAATGSGRGLGVVESGTVAAAGAAGAAGAARAAVTMIGGRRDQTALGLVGLDEAELRRRREEFGGARHRPAAVLSPGTSQLGEGDAWRTRLASTTRPAGTVQHWTGSGADPLPRASVLAYRSGSVDRDVRGAVLRTGRPAHEAS